ncbi:FtsW/RodA/SpoVE family cell cycle protein [Rhodocaloribacter litoris]|nr:FtsW/RodA/SpoVE family cell cycle protein [Rhodocaloribacter litoris]
MLKQMKLLSRAPADKYVVWAVLALGAVGVVAVYSAVSFLAETKAGGDTERFLLRHVGRLALALGMVGLFSLVDYRQLARKARIGVVAALALLLAVLVVGDASGGASRWVFGFQPSDLARVALLLHVAFLLAKKQGYIGDFKRAFVPLCLWTGAVVGLIGLEDLSTAAVVLVSVMLMCFVGRVRVLHLSGVVALGVVAAYLLLLASPERAERLEAYVGVKLFPHTDAEAVFSSQDEGYQARQARIAFAMGGLTGVGPGKSIQRDFLPAPYNDFIFAIIAEEYGILGALALLAVFVLLLFRGFLRIARHAPDPLGLLLGTGLVTMLALYGFIHAGVAAGLLPVTGLPMPFVSYGGTSMVANGVMVGILLNISRQATGPGAP